MESMQLVQMPPEIINMIYNSADIKSKVNLSMVNVFIYDCRPITEINNCKWKIIHSKNMAPNLDRIKSIEYSIGKRFVDSLGVNAHQSIRQINYRNTVYTCYDDAVGVHSYNRNRFVPRARMMRKQYKVRVDINLTETMLWTHMLLYETHANYLYGDYKN